MTKGRSSKSNVTKLRDGNPGRRPIDNKKKTPVELPDAPKDMADDEKIIWIETVAELESNGVIARVDKYQIETYCAIVARARRLRKYLSSVDPLTNEVRGETYETMGKNGLMIRTRPQASMLQKDESAIRAWASEWGMTGASRSRLNIGDGQGELPLDPTDI